MRLLARMKRFPRFLPLREKLKYIYIYKLYSISNSLLETFIEQSIGQLLIKIIVVIQKKRKLNGRRNEVSNDFYKYLDHRESVKSAQKLASLFILVVPPLGHCVCRKRERKERRREKTASIESRGRRGREEISFAVAKCARFTLPRRKWVRAEPNDLARFPSPRYTFSLHRILTGKNTASIVFNPSLPRPFPERKTGDAVNDILVYTAMTMTLPLLPLRSLFRSNSFLTLILCSENRNETRSSSLENRVKYIYISQIIIANKKEIKNLFFLSSKQSGMYTS